MISRLVTRFCFKWSSRILAGFLIFYIYGVALYFLYSNQGRVDRYTLNDEHPKHDHPGEGGGWVGGGAGELPEGFSSWADVMKGFTLFFELKKQFGIYCYKTEIILRVVF